MAPTPQFGLTPLQAQALAVIQSHGAPISGYALSRQLGREKSFGYRIAKRLRDRGHVVISPDGIVPVGLRFIAIGTREPGTEHPTAATDRYPFLGHRSCAEWGSRSLHGEAA